MWKRGGQFENWVDAQLLRTEGRRLKGGRGEGKKAGSRRGNFTGERVQKMGRMGDRVTLSRGERR